MPRDLTVRILGDEKNLSKTFRSAGDDVDGFGKKASGAAKGGLGMLAKGGILAGGILGGGFLAALKHGVDGLGDHQKVAAQSAAVLKSTGNAAHTSTKEMDDLASSIEAKTGIDADQIQSGANLLATFGNVSNQLGKNNDIFNQATKAATDMSVAFGQSAASSSIMLGKALDNPIKGVSALTRVGITFTEAEKKKIAALQESGDVLGAQKIILAAVNKQVAGSAEAYGTTFPGQLDRLKAKFNEVTEQLAAAVMPALMRFANWAIANAPVAIQALQTAWETYGRPAFDALKSALETVVTFAQEHWPQVQAAAEAVMAWYTTTLAPAIASAIETIKVVIAAVATAAEESWPRVQSAAQRAADYYTNTILPAFSSVMGAIKSVIGDDLENVRAGWDRFGGAILAITNLAWVAIKLAVLTPFQQMASVITGVLKVLQGDWSGAWDAMKDYVKTPLAGIKALIDAALPAITKSATALGEGAVDGLKAGFKEFKNKASDAMDAARQALADSPRLLFHAASAIGEGAVDGILAGLASLAGEVTRLVKDALNAPIRLFNALAIPSKSFSVHIPGLGPFGGGTIGFSTPSFELPDLDTFDSGGVVPGPRGMPIPILAHGGETVLPTHKGGGGQVNNFYLPAGLDEHAVAALISRKLRVAF